MVGQQANQDADRAEVCVHANMRVCLFQVKKKLKDQGLEDDLKLSWKTQSDGQVFHKEKKKEPRKRRKRGITKRVEL